ncbi:MAG: succinylglutamate desuccinylase/aspartoacylase family protein [Deltaproteobacteria bacterium]|nr:succinylglutamate desuccinylase/aspartoacylase family protein [Deltaproteobacteria bacterium]
MIEDVFVLQVPFRGTYRLQRIRFGQGRPRLVVVAGLHGNELNGIHAVHLLASALREQRPIGTVDLLPLVNVFGIEDGTKRGPFEGEDLNEVFPGHPLGTAMQRVAYAVLEATDADVCVDVHSGSPLVQEMPQVRLPLAGPEVDLGRATGLPFVWRRPTGGREPSGLVGAWRALGRRGFRITGGRGGSLDPRDSVAMANGVRRLMAALGMGSNVGPGETLVDVTHDEITAHRCETGGFFVPESRVGMRVLPGHLLGRVLDPVGGEVLETVRADRAGLVTNLRVYPMVHAEELLVRVAALR